MANIQYGADLIRHTYTDAQLLAALNRASMGTLAEYIDEVRALARVIYHEQVPKKYERARPEYETREWNAMVREIQCAVRASYQGRFLGPHEAMES